MERMFKKLPGFFRFLLGTALGYMGIVVCWHDYSPLLLRMAGIAIVICGMFVMLHDYED